MPPISQCYTLILIILLVILLASRICLRCDNKIVQGILLITAWIKLIPQLLLMKDKKGNLLALTQLIGVTSNVVSPLSKGLKFVPTPKGVNKAHIKEELETYGRKLRLMQHFRNDARGFSYDPLKKKSKFDPKRKQEAIELYLSRLEEEISSLDYKVRYSNLKKGERDAVYSLKNENSVIIKEADKGSAVFVWNREDCLKEAKSQLSDKKCL